MIPKNIYYVWVGGGPKPEIFYQCLESWKNNLPDYTITEINESNFDFDYHLKRNKFFKACYEKKMWAFVSDYIRVVHLYENGGIYLDTDMQILKDFSGLFDSDTEFFAGLEEPEVVSAGIIGAKRNSLILKKVIDFYDKDIWNSCLYTIPSIITHVLNNILQSDGPIESSYYSKKIAVFPPHYFYPYHYTEKYSPECIKENTYGIHWWGNSWKDLKNYLFLRTKHRSFFTKPIFKAAIYFRYRKQYKD